MKVNIEVHYGDDVFISDLSENIDQETYDKLEDLVETAASGELNYLSIMINGHAVYFSKRIIKRSIIHIFKHD